MNERPPIIIVGANHAGTRLIVDILRNSERLRASTLQQWQQMGRRSLFDVIAADKSLTAVVLADGDIQFEWTVCELFYFVDLLGDVITESVSDFNVTSDEVEFHDDLP